MKINEDRFGWDWKGPTARRARTRKHAEGARSVVRSQGDSKGIACSRAADLLGDAERVGGL